VRLAVSIEKGLDNACLLLPLKRDAAGKVVPDPDMTAVIAALTIGDKVEIVPEGSSIKFLWPYAKPHAAVFVAVVQEVADGRAVTGIRVKEGGKEVTFMVNPRHPASADLAARARKFRADQAVLIRTRTEGGKEWLAEVNLPK
jgi:hypothetical protein